MLKVSNIHLDLSPPTNHDPLFLFLRRIFVMNATTYLKADGEGFERRCIVERASIKSGSSKKMNYPGRRRDFSYEESEKDLYPVGRCCASNETAEGKNAQSDFV